MRWNLVLALLILAGWTIGEEEIKIVFTGDIFGYYEGLYEESEAPFTQPPLEGKNSSGAEIGGLARLKKILSSLPPDKTILVDGGGFLVGNAFWSSQLNGSSIASILTNTSYDLVMLGDLDFDDGKDKAVEFYNFLNENGTKVLVSGASSEDYKKPFDIVDKNSKKIAFISYVIPDAFENDFQNETFAFENYKEVIKNALADNTVKGANAVIALASGGSMRHHIEILKENPRINVILLSYGVLEWWHGGQVIHMESERMIVSSVPKARYFQSVNLVFDPSGNFASATVNFTLLNETKDEATGEYLLGLRNEFKYKFDNETYDEIEVSWAIPADGCHHGECAIGDLVADAIQSCPKSPDHILHAIIPSIIIARGLPQGKVRMSEDVMNTAPRDLSLVQVNMTGRDLKYLFERAADIMVTKQFDKGCSPLQIAGMTMRYNPNEGNGSRVEKIRALRKNGTTVNFVEVDPNDSKVNYMVVMPEALAAGKFCYYGLKSFKVGYAAIPLNETVSECVFNMAKKRKSLEWSVEGRILAEEPTTIWKEITSDPGKVVLGLMFGALLIFNLWYFVTRSDWWRRNCRRGQYLKKLNSAGRRIVLLHLFPHIPDRTAFACK